MDGKKFVSSSADCTVKLWDAESRQVERTWTFAESPAVEDQQVGNVWSKYIVSLSLGGRFSYFSPSEAQPIRFVSVRSFIPRSTTIAIRLTGFLGSSTGNYFVYRNQKRLDHFFLFWRLRGPCFRVGRWVRRATFWQWAYESSARALRGC